MGILPGKSRQGGISLVELMFAMGIMAVALIPIMGVMQSGQVQGVRDESEVEANEKANVILTSLMNDVPFISILPGGVKWDTNLVDGSRSVALNKNLAGAGSGDIIIDSPVTSTRNEGEEYMNGLLYKNGTPSCSYADDRGIRYVVSLRCQIVWISFAFFETREDSCWNGNNMGGSPVWEVKQLQDESSTSGTPNYVFGDGSTSVAPPAGPPYKFLQGDAPDSRLKKLVVSIAYEKKKGAFRSGVSADQAWKDAKSVHLVAYKSKLED
ncbi:MAG: hypothetical protein CVV64_06770 [Candidatus Wallbacteria bacterium HGW-Wallbacteria-1]|uniref:Uncharacterized protein n=1 Tax=Candidatus Wallbacteria bacterium HGW-Wallbacteria-1 TaxID=2013854 RepID=A0A2N1PT56_9BACT|nr:MAG: hypothetical protein CVV64_06770 [Candidatus Wallbacteria bacterium HGW-Wallbacteria-1]